MRIGTVRAGETAVRNSHAGYHQFHEEKTQEPFGSFEVFHADGYNGLLDAGDDKLEDGWYWWPCWGGCLPDGEPSGPFASSRQALEDADEWHSEFNGDYDYE